MLIKNLQSVIWSNLMTVTLLPKKQLQTLLPKICKDIADHKKSYSDYSKQIQIAIDIYIENLELLEL